MKAFIYFILFVLVILTQGCAQKKLITQEKNKLVVQHDTIHIISVDTIPVVKMDTVYKNGETLKQADAISTLAQIIYYEKIIAHNPIQKKFEHGWILRALKYYNLPLPTTKK
jgi:hypothetical protein